MFKMIVCLFVAICFSGVSKAQEAGKLAERSKVPGSYIVQLTEYKLLEPLNPTQSSAEILALVSGKGGDSRVKLVEMIRLSTLSDTESLVQFGKSLNVTVGKVQTGRGNTVRSTRTMSVGTIVRVTLSPGEEKVGLKLSYESSKLDEKHEEGVPPNVVKTQIGTTQILELGKPTLIGSSTAATSSIIVATVNRN